MENGVKSGKSSLSSLSSNSSCLAATAFLQEYELMQEVLFALVGTQGKILRKNVITGEFKLDHKQKDIAMSQALMMLRIAKVGYFYDQVKNFTSPNSGCFLRGLIGQGLVSALNKELTDYHGMVAHLQEQLTYQRENPDVDQDLLSLMQISIWVVKPLDRLQWLTDIATACSKDMRGGQIASVVFEFMHHGSQIVKGIARDLLIHCCQPLQVRKKSRALNLVACRQ